MPRIKKIESKLTMPVYDLEGKATGTLEMPKDILDIKLNPNLLAQYTRFYLTNKRQGTAATKTRSMVIGSTRKIYKQKGTGRARHGDIKAPIFVGGGVVGGPTPRDYSLKFNKKQKRKALFNALSLKFKEGNLIGLSQGSKQTEVKTKNFANFLKSLALYGEKVLLIFPQEKNNNLYLASRNIKNIVLSSVSSVNPYLLLNNKKIIFLEEAWDNFRSYFLKNSENK